MADATSIEETNKVRIALGIQPLPVPGAGPAFKDSDSEESDDDQGSTLESREAEGFNNWKKLQDEAEAKQRRDARNKAIKKAREEAQRLGKLQGKGLGEAEGGDELDTKTWLLKQKKRQKKLERERERTKRIEQELKEREEAAQYTSKDLAGVRVAHEAGDFEVDGTEQVLTLKDATIDENEEEGDELENAQLVEKEKRDERLSLKKKKPGYYPAQLIDDDSHGVLQQYDEVIDGKKRKRLVLDGEGLYAGKAADDDASIEAKKKKLQAVSLDILKELPTSDYQEPKEVKIKKPKQKRAKSSRKKVIDENDVFPTSATNDTDTNADSMEVDSSSISKPIPKKSTFFVDDEDLQASLTKQRREALKNRKNLKPKDLARQIREEASATPEIKMEDDEPEEGGLVLDETTEFVSNLQRPEPLKPRPLSAIKAEDKIQSPPESPHSDGGEDVDMDKLYNQMEGLERTEREGSTPAPGLTETGLDEETTLRTGIGSTVNLLTQRGILKRHEDNELAQKDRDRQRFLTEKDKRLKEADARARAQRERDRSSGYLDRMSAREREEYARRENKQRDQAESRQMAEIFNREYKPNVQLKYIDDFGREMNQKEAFKHLSHQFHGKGSGKQKTEKLLKKIEEGKKREAASNLDSSGGGGMNNAQSATMKKNKQAGVRLA